MSTFLALSQAVFPLFPNWLAALPGGAQLALEGRYAEAAVLVILHVYGMDYGLSKIHREIPGHNTYLTGLSIAGGMALFSPALEVSSSFHGVFYFILILKQAHSFQVSLHSSCELGVTES